MAGTKSIRVYQAMLRHTKTVAASYQIPASLTDIGEVFSSARLINQEPIPNVISGMMPAGSSVTLSAGMTAYRGWLKGFPTITLSANGKAQIVQEWEFGDWSDTIYTINQ
jgi:hypothetical protein